MADIYTYLATKNLGVDYGYSLSFNSTGTMAYIVYQSLSPERVRELSFSIPWNISTATFTANTLSPTTYLQSCFLAPDSSNIYICQRLAYGVFNVYQYSLSGDLSTAVHVHTKDFSDAAGTGSNWIHSGFITADGISLFLSVDTSSGGLRITKYVLSSPFDIETAVKVDVFTFFSGGFAPNLFMSPTGRRLYAVNFGTANLIRVDFSTAWDLSTYTETDITDIGGARIAGFFANEDSEIFYILKDPGTNTLDLNTYGFTPVPVEFWTNFSGQTEILE